ncbi:MAG: dockerin type I repeat-containing protein [Prevotella sp.]|nr:dockerin type I repeat-containing protein [Prevotella sp.]
MNTSNNNLRHWAVLLFLLVWLPINGLAQTAKFEMVVERNDGTELAFRITDDFPQLQYSYGGEEGVNTIEIQTAAGNTSVPCPEIKRLFTREVVVVQGDVTGSGTVDIQDATIVVNYILNPESGEGSDMTVADMNGDGEVDVFDVTAIINVILSGGGNSMSARSNIRQHESSESVNMTADGKGVLLDIANANRFTSFQFDVEVPQGVELLGIDWSQTTNHSLQFAKTGESRYTVVALSLESSPLPSTGEGLLRLRFSGMGSGEVGISNVLFVTPQGEAARFGNSTLNMTSGIHGITCTQGEQIFDLSGRRLIIKREELGKGIYMIGNNKVVIK